MPLKDIKARKVYQKDYGRKHYEQHKQKYLKQNRVRREARRAWFVEYRKTLKCVRCSEGDWRCLDFHHVDRDKDKSIPSTISRMVTMCYSIERILKEIKKCEVLCANCHRRESFERDWC